MNQPIDYDLLTLKQPPHSAEAEQSVIGALLIGGGLDAVSEFLSESDFYRPENRLIYRAIEALHADGQPYDLTTVDTALNGDPGYAHAGGFAYIAGLARNTPSAANVRAYAHAVLERSMLRQLIIAGQEIADDGYNAEGRKASELVDIAQQKILAMGERSTPEADLHISIGFDDYIKELQRRVDNEGLAGLATGFSAIDKRTNGLMGGDLVIVAGRPGSGKTTFAMNIAEYVGMQLDKSVLVFSMEMPRLQLIDRLVSSFGKIPFSLLRSGAAFGHPQFDGMIIPAADRVKKSKIFIDERGGLTVQQMRTSARRLHKKTPLSLIVIDYIQLARSKGENRVMEITHISQALKALAKELSIPIIALSQLSRKCEEQKRRPISSDLRDSGSIEQDADSIFLIYRDEQYNDNIKTKGLAEIHCTKLRNGEPGLDFLQSELSTCRFIDKPDGFKPPAEEPEEKTRKERGLPR